MTLTLGHFLTLGAMLFALSVVGIFLNRKNLIVLLMAIELIRDLGRRGVRLRSLTEPFLDVDTSTPMGEAIVGIMAVLAQLRVSTIRENTRRGLAHARAQGRVGGRPSVMTPERIKAAVKMRDQDMSIAEIARTFGVGASSVSRALAKHDVGGHDRSSPSPR